MSLGVKICQHFIQDGKKKHLIIWMQERRALLLTGPRQSGKTTLARELESEQVEYRTLDDSTLREAAESDPQWFVKRRTRTLIIDEAQYVPSLLPAIKKAVYEDTSQGQYLLTGSANIQSLATVRESLAGRIAKIRLRPPAFGEIDKKSLSLLNQPLSSHSQTNIVIMIVMPFMNYFIIVIEKNVKLIF